MNRKFTTWNGIIKKIFLDAFAIVVLCFGVACMGCARNIAGGSTETTNQAVVGILYRPDGKTPAAGAIVHMKKRSDMSSLALSGLPKVAIDVATTVTDVNGKFGITTIDPGLYVIEANDDHGNLAFIDSVSIIPAVATVQLAPATLKPAGAIKGRILLSSGGDPRKVFVIAYQAIQFGIVDTSGWFTIPDMPEGRYTVRFIPALDGYDVFDSANVEVRSADTTDLGAIALKYSGIPVAMNLSISYDSLLQIATLTWSRADTSLVKGYNIFRRDIDSGFGLTPLNGIVLVKDTVFRDSSVHKGESYEYKVVPIDKNGNPGKMTGGSTITATSVFKYVESHVFAWVWHIPDLFISCLLNLKNGGVALTVNSQSSVYLFDALYKPTTTFGIDTGGSVSPSYVNLDWGVMADDDAGHFFIWSYPTLYKVNTSGTVLGSYAYFADYHGIVCKGNKLYISNRGLGGIGIMTTDLDTLSQKFIPLGDTSFHAIGTSEQAQIAIDSLDRLYVNFRRYDGRGMNLGGAVYVLDTSGTMLSHWDYSADTVSSMAIGPHGYVFLLEPAESRIEAYNADGRLMARMEIEKDILNPGDNAQDLYPRLISFDKAGNLFVAFRYFIKKYTCNLN
jgi:hypothetical protein